jgi:hypothetical protein
VSNRSFLALASVLLAAPLLSAPLMAQTAHHAKHTVSTDIPWKQIYNDDSVAVSIDPHGTIKHKDGTYTAHLRWAYTSDREIGRGKSYRIMRETRLVDCSTMGTKPISANTYDIKGKLISSFDTKPKDMQYLSWTARKPGSASANVFEGVCQALKKSK